MNNTEICISTEIGNGNPHQYSCLENSTDGGAWQATDNGVAESDMTEHAQYAFLHTH